MLSRRDRFCFSGSDGRYALGIQRTNNVQMAPKIIGYGLSSMKIRVSFVVANGDFMRYTEVSAHCFSQVTQDLGIVW